MSLTVTSHHPRFVPDQIVTDVQLNQLRAHLDGQDRATRVCLVGTGIVCGLAASVDGNDHIAVREGFGISGDGHLVATDPIVYTHYLDDPEADEPWLQDTPWQTVDELLDADAAAAVTAPAQAVQLDATLRQGRVLVLYLEEESVHKRSCPVTESHEEGIEVRLNLRALLVAEADLGPLITPTPPVRQRLAPLRLADFNGAADWQTLYDAAFGTGQLATVVPDAFTQWGAVLGLDPALPSSLAARLAAIPGATNAGQQHYGLLRDLALAHDEALSAAGRLVPCQGGPSAGRYLVLGGFDESTGTATSPRRQSFRRSPVWDTARGELARVRRLFRRLAEIPEAFDPALAAGGVRLTPSRVEDYPLGRQALPACYPAGGDLAALWRSRETGEPLWSYHHRDTGGPDVHDLDLDANQASLVRIEGHLGLAGDAALDAVVAERGRHNVAFEAMRVDLEDVVADEDTAAALVDDALVAWDDAAKTLDDVLGRLLAGETDALDVAGAAHTVVTAESDLAPPLAAWSTLRRGRRLHCDATVLRTAWAAARAELLSVLHSLRGEVSSSAATIGSVHQALTLNDVQEMMVERLGAALLVAREFDQTPIEDAVDAILTATDIGSALDELAHLANWALLDSIDALADVAASDLHDVRCELLTWRFRHLFANLRCGLHQDLADPKQWPLSARVRALYARLATICIAWEELRRTDLGVLANLLDAVEGFTHLAGVVPGGTFVLVCEKGDVVADFSLPGRLPCRCGIDLSAIDPPPLEV